jgi:hypothetical protein
MKRSIIFAIVLLIVFTGTALAQKMIVRDSDTNILMQVNDEGTTGSISLPSGSAPTVTLGKLYNVGGTLYWAGTDLSSGLTLPYSGTHTAAGIGFTVTADHASGRAGLFQISNASNAVTALAAATDGSGNALLAKNNGTGRGAYVQIDNASNSVEALGVTTNGTGDALVVDHTGASGNIAVFQSGGSNRLVLTQDGDGVFAGGIATGGRINAPNHNNDKGLNLPANAGVPAAVTGTVEGDIVWDSTNDDLYVYNGSSFTEIGPAATPSGWTDSGSKVYVTTATDWVGIGTTNPPDLFVVNGGALDGHMRFQDNTSGATLSDGLWVGYTSGNVHIHNYEDTDVRFGTNNNTRMTIENDGDVGIGTTDPVADLHIVGSSTLGSVMIAPNADSDQDAQLIIAEDDDGTYGIKFTYNGGDNRFYVYGENDGSSDGPFVCINRIGGNMGIGIGTNGPDATLEVGGQVKITGGTPGAGQVLTSDTDGLATWEVASIDNLTDGIYSGESVFLGNGAGVVDDGVDNYNAGIGHNAMNSNTGGRHNVAVGWSALSTETVGDENVAIGSGALSNSTADFNTAIGYNAGYQALGSQNVFIGHSAGYNEAGNQKLYIENSNSSNPLIGGSFLYDRVGINTASPTVTLHISGTDAVLVPVGDESERPASPTVGMIRYNTDSGKFEGYAVSSWVNLH